VIRSLLKESCQFVEWTAVQMAPANLSHFADLQTDLRRWHALWSTLQDDPASHARLAIEAHAWSDKMLELSGLLDDTGDNESSEVTSPKTQGNPSGQVLASDALVTVITTPIDAMLLGADHDAFMRSILASLKTVPQPFGTSVKQRNLSIEESGRRAIRAAKFEETPMDVWLKVLPTIPEGVSTTRASELFGWAREMLIERERERGLSETAAIEAATLTLLTENVY